MQVQIMIILREHLKNFIINSTGLLIQVSQTVSVLACETHIVFSTPILGLMQSLVPRTTRTTTGKDFKSSGPFNPKKAHNVKQPQKLVWKKHHTKSIIKMNIIKLNFINSSQRSEKKKREVFWWLTLERCPWRIGGKAAGIELPGWCKRLIQGGTGVNGWRVGSISSWMVFEWGFSNVIWLVVEPTHLKNMLVKVDHYPQVGVKLKNVWNHHLVMLVFRG